jgi:hypothetical protein
MPPDVLPLVPPDVLSPLLPEVPPLVPFEPELDVLFVVSVIHAKKKQAAVKAPTQRKLFMPHLREAS